MRFTARIPGAKTKLVSHARPFNRCRNRSSIGGGRHPLDAGQFSKAANRGCRVITNPNPLSHPDPAPSPTPTPSPISTPTPEPSATPTVTGETGGTIDFDITLPEIAELKRQVLKRIDLMPSVSTQNKDKLYGAVDRSRGMGRLFTVSFETSFTKISPDQIAYVKSQLEHPQVQKLLDDPTLVLVILGYADKQGDDQKNLQISTARAQAVMDMLRDQFAIQNVMHIVPMGGTNLLDARELAKNRVVEVWAVLP